MGFLSVRSRPFAQPQAWPGAGRWRMSHVLASTSVCTVASVRPNMINQVESPPAIVFLDLIHFRLALRTKEGHPSIRSSASIRELGFVNTYRSPDP